MEQKQENRTQPLMSGFDILRLVESLLIAALIAISLWSFWAVLFQSATHQLIIAIPSAILAVVLTCRQIKEQEGEKVDA